MAQREAISLTCPLCLTKFESEVLTHVMATGQDTDGRLHFREADPLPTFIHTCPTCSFTASRGAFHVHLGDEEIFRVRAFIETIPKPETSSERYMLMAQVMDQYRRDDPIFPANAWLTASWCARQEGNREVEQDCQKRAIRWFDEDLRLGLAQQEERTYLTYLVGELNRRIGEFARAREYFNAVPTLASPTSAEDRFLVTMSVLQKHYAGQQTHVNTRVPQEFINRGLYLRHFRNRLEQGSTRPEVSAV